MQLERGPFSFLSMLQLWIIRHGVYNIFDDWRTTNKSDQIELGNTSRAWVTTSGKIQVMLPLKNSQRPWWSHTGTFHIPSFAHGFPSTLSEHVQIVRITGSVPSSTRVRRKPFPVTDTSRSHYGNRGNTSVSAINILVHSYQQRSGIQGWKDVAIFWN